MRITRIIGIVFLSSGFVLRAQDNTPKYSNEFMNLGVGARYLGMGNASVGIVDDVTSGYWNPAGLLNMDSDHQLVLMHAAYFAGIANYDYGAFATKLDEESSLGLSLLRFAVDDIPDTRFLFDANGRIDYSRIQFFSAADYGVLLSYARKVKGFALGGNAKVIYRRAGEFAHAWGFGLDLGLQRSFGPWQMGIMGKDLFGTFNAWSHNPDELRQVYTATGNDLPVNSLEITLPRLIVGGGRTFALGDKFDLQASLDMDITFDGKRNTLIRTDFLSIDPHVGFELGFRQLAFLRGGLAQFQQVKGSDGDTNWSFLPSLGVGVRLSDVMIDYAMTDIGDAAEGLYSHIFSIKVNFHGKED